MSTRVYLSKYPYPTTPEEDTPVCSRIQLSHATVKELQSRLQHVYRRDDVRLVRRTTVWLDLLVHPVPMEGLCAHTGGSAQPASLGGVRTSCCEAWTASSTAMAAGAARSWRRSRRDAW
jgi:hypothetical protein